jgi:hypothetical protein
MSIKPEDTDPPSPRLRRVKDTEDTKDTDEKEGSEGTEDGEDVDDVRVHRMGVGTVPSSRCFKVRSRERAVRNPAGVRPRWRRARNSGA